MKVLSLAVNAMRPFNQRGGWLSSYKGEVFNKGETFVKIIFWT